MTTWVAKVDEKKNLINVIAQTKEFGEGLAQTREFGEGLASATNAIIKRPFSMIRCCVSAARISDEIKNWSESHR